MKDARLKHPQAAIEDMDARVGCGTDRKAAMSLALGDWIDSGHSVRITGPTGAGKSWLAAQYAYRRDRSAYYQRMPGLDEELRIRHGNGTFGKWLIQLAQTDVLLLDDWGMAALDVQARSDLLEIIDDWTASKATIITSQLPIEHWHAWVGDVSRTGGHARAFLDEWHGRLVCGDLSGNNSGFAWDMTEVGSTAHARRKFVGLYLALKSSVAATALDFIGQPAQ